MALCLWGTQAAGTALATQDRIKIETPFATTVYQMKISGDHLVLQDLGGSNSNSRRIARRSADCVEQSKQQEIPPAFA